jgi:peptide/nickel transport system ATP-binding protein
MSEPVLRIDDLSVSFRTRAGPIVAVDRTSFEIRAGETLGLIGESGSGKSVTGLAILNLLDPSATRRTSGIFLAGQRIDALDNEATARLRGAQIAMIFQDPTTALNPVMRIGDQIVETLRAHEQISKREALRRAADALAQVAIPDPRASLTAYPHQFSGGMRQRVCIAIALLCRPRLIIADEPTTALDSLVQLDVLNLLTRLTREQGTALLLISHNLPLVAHFAQRGIVMHRGRIVDEGPIAGLMANPRDEYTRALVDAVPQRATQVATRGAQKLAEARDVSISFRSGRRLFRKPRITKAVDRVSLTIHAGETLALVGASGSGKSTLGRLLLRLYNSDGGTLLFEGFDATRGSGPGIAALRDRAQMIFQDPYASLNPRQRIIDIVAEPLHAHGDGPRRNRSDRARAMLRSVGLEDYADRLPSQLSGGQRQRVAIARALVRNPTFVVADEPISALDMTIQKQVLELFRRLQAEQRFACLFISHDLAAVGALADRIAVMQAGRIVEEGPRDDVLDRPQHDYTRRLWAASFGTVAARTRGDQS